MRPHFLLISITMTFARLFAHHYILTTINNGLPRTLTIVIDKILNTPIHQLNYLNQTACFRGTSSCKCAPAVHIISIEILHILHCYYNLYARGYDAMFGRAAQLSCRVKIALGSLKRAEFANTE